jgi:hypothetical protein
LFFEALISVRLVLLLYALSQPNLLLGCVQELTGVPLSGFEFQHDALHGFAWLSARSTGPGCFFVRHLGALSDDRADDDPPPSLVDADPLQLAEQSVGTQTDTKSDIIYISVVSIGQRGYTRTRADIVLVPVRVPW